MVGSGVGMGVGGCVFSVVIKFICTFSVCSFHLNFLLLWGCTSGGVYCGVYVPCIYTRARCELLWLRSLFSCLSDVF